MYKYYLYCIHIAALYDMVSLFKAVLKFQNEEYINKLGSCDVVFLRHQCH